MKKLVLVLMIALLAIPLFSLTNEDYTTIGGTYEWQYSKNHGWTNSAGLELTTTTGFDNSNFGLFGGGSLFYPFNVYSSNYHYTTNDGFQMFGAELVFGVNYTISFNYYDDLIIGVGPQIRDTFAWIQSSSTDQLDFGAFVDVAFRHVFSQNCALTLGCRGDYSLVRVTFEKINGKQTNTASVEDQNFVIHPYVGITLCK